MQTDDLNIENSLSFSEQLDGLIQGHQMEMQQVLADKKHLRSIIVYLQNVIADKQAIIKQKDEQIAQLLQRITDLEKPTTVTSVAGNYIEQMQINKMNISASLPKRTKSKRVLNTSDILQLPLWQTS